MTALPTLKLRVLPTFPASVTGDGTISITKTNGVYTIGFDTSISPTWTGNHTFSPAVGDAITITPLAGSAGRSINSTQSTPATGTVAGPFALNLWNITHSYRVTGSGSDSTGNNNAGAVGFRVNQNITTAGVASTSAPIITGLFTATVSTTTAITDVTGLAGTAYTNVAMAGGAFLEGMNAVAHVGPTGSANVLAGLDAGAFIDAGGTAVSRVGVAINSGGAVAGTTLDAAISFNATSATIKFGKVFAFSNLSGQAPIGATTDVFYADTAYSIANFASLANMTVTDHILNFPSVHLRGSNASLGLGTSNNPGSNSILVTGIITANGQLGSGGAGVGNGVLSLGGNTSGGVTQTVQAVAGTPTVTWGTSSGTPVVTASAPFTITAATGNLSATTSGSGTTILLGTSPSITTSATISNNGIGAVSADGLVLQNTTAAAAGAQQYSPRLHFIGQGWKTDATAASQTVDWLIENEPTQGTAAPTSFLAFLSQINGGGYATKASLSSGGVLNLSTGIQIAGAATSGNALIGDGTNFVSSSLNATIAAIFQNYMTGLGMTWASTTTFTVAAGVATDSTNVIAMTLGSALTKSTSAWAVGTGNGGLDTGAIAATTWYHVYLIRRSDTGVVDVLFSTSASAPTMPTNYGQKRRIGSVLTNGSSQFVKWIQDGDLFVWDVPVLDVNGAANPGTSAVTRTLTVPTGVRVRANMSVYVEATTSAAAPGGIFISDLSQTDTAASGTVWSIYSLVTYSASVTDAILGANVQCMTNTSGQVRSRLQVSTANTILNISTNGWTDFRGRNG